MEEDYIKGRAANILNTILSYARLEFDQKTEITEREDVFDAIGAGVNMLGEELQSSTISLKEKEQLLKEVHHRVKNNLQIISSLLNLQSEHIQDEKFLEVIRESKIRIASMALIHEMLYATKDFSHVKVNDYVSRLYQSIYRTFLGESDQVSFLLEVDEKLTFEIDTMIPLGLILNEIISNSMKYAFPDGKGTIRLSITKTEQKYLLEVSDDGIGIPAEFQLQNAKSLGIQLIHMLSEQINAELSLDRSSGTCYKLYF